jgi:SNF2 family DNA or RNA helicase
LTELVTGTLKGRRGIIWYNMSAELEIISKALDSAGISYLVIKGGEKDTGGKVRRFNVDPSVSWLVCQAKSVNYGITVLGKSAEDLEEMDIELPPGITPEVYTHIYYSLNFSLEVYLQQQDRSHRIGQKHACEYYRLITNAPIEHHIVRALHRKRNIRNEMLIDYIEKLKKDSLNVNVSDRPERSDNPNLSEQPDLPEPPEPAGLSDGDLGW